MWCHFCGYYFYGFASIVLFPWFISIVLTNRLVLLQCKISTDSASDGSTVLVDSTTAPGKYRQLLRTPKLT